MVRQIAKCAVSRGEREALFYSQKNHTNQEGYFFKDGVNRKKVKCYRCSKIGYIKKNCQVKLREGNIANKEDNSNEIEEN